MHAIALRYLIEVGRSSSIRRAAETLNVSSTALNRQILNIERRLGTKLFERTRSGIVPTPAGEMAIQHARDTLSAFERLLSDVSSASDGVAGHVRLVAIPSMLRRIVPEVICRLTAQYPAVSFSVSEELSQLIQARHYDVGVIAIDDHQRGIDVLSEIEVRVGFIMRPDHPMAARPDISFDDCMNCDVVLLGGVSEDARFVSAAARHGQSFTPRLVASSLEMLRKCVLAGMGITYFSETMFLEELAAGTLVFRSARESRQETARVGIVVPTGFRLSSASTATIDALREEMHALRSRYHLPAR